MFGRIVCLSCALFVFINILQSFERLNPRSVAVVVDPIQSVKGKVVIDAFRTISRQIQMLGRSLCCTDYLGRSPSPIFVIEVFCVKLALSLRDLTMQVWSRAKPLHTFPSSTNRLFRFA